MKSDFNPSQIESLRKYAKKWRAIGLSTAPANRLEAEAGIRQFYQHIGLRTPTIKWYDSPKAMYDAVIDHIPAKQQLKWIHNDREGLKHRPKQDMPDVAFLEKILTQPLGSSIWNAIRLPILHALDVDARRIGVGYGQHYVAMYGVTDYFENEFGWRQSADLKAESQVAQNSGWWLPYPDICFVCERPSTLKLDEQDRPHSEYGQAIMYPDGWGIYLWHGVNVPEWLIRQPNKITPQKIMAEENVEIARIMLDRYGQDKFIREGGFNKVQSDQFGELYRIEFNNGDEPIVAVKVLDSSTHREYFLYVPPHIRTAHEGVAWSFGYDSADEYQPEQET